MNPGLLMMVIGFAALGVGLWRAGRGARSRDLAAIATLGALSAAGRVVFAPIPSVQPSTVLVLLTGWVLGPAPGFLVGATTALVSNLFMGQGPWTIWQMLAWGLVGAVGGLLGRRTPADRVWVVAVVSAVAGFAFSGLMDLWFWVSFVYPLTLKSWLVTVAASTWFNLMHAGGNVVFALVLTRQVVKALERHRERMRVEFREAEPVV
jgi:energy-coupling factor transport system substrate-specific component